MLGKQDFYKRLKLIPKAELHLHCEGVVSKKTVLALLKRARPEEHYDVARVDELFRFSNLSEFIEIFLAVQKAFKKTEDFDVLFEDMKKYLVDNGVVYSETFISPTSFVRNGLNFQEIIDRVIRKIRDIKMHHKIEIKLLVDVSRTFGAQNAMDNLEMVLSLREKYSEIIGIGLGGDELKGPAKEFKDVFERAQKEGLRVVAHAGESVGPESVWDALRALHVERIGHGISSIQDAELIAYLAVHHIPLEICPTSNVFTRHYVLSIEEHPVKEFYKAGVPVTLNTDDPTFFGIGLLDEYYALYTKLGFSLTALKEIIINGFKYSFSDKKQIDQMIDTVNTAWSQQFPDECV